jgi:23S rRNA G2069 N7-methylase RlmK/C1962 C5-methylase RlmI
VVAVDSSDKAIDRARENLLLNENLDSSKAQFIESDAESFMQAAISRGESYDVIVLDPPKLAPNADALAKAKKK